MEKPKVNVLAIIFAYSGNGGIPSYATKVGTWLMDTAVRVQKDERVGAFQALELCDTPITMTRNRAVTMARKLKADMLLMADSDMHPDVYLRDGAPRFWDTAFEFAYERKRRHDLPTVIGAPYTGPPTDVYGGGESNTYVFRWYERESPGDGEDPTQRHAVDLSFLGRNEAIMLSGIQHMAALPTGLILYTMDAFDLIKPPYFRYEYRNEFEDEKVTTEDVYNTREISLAAAAKGLGDVCFAAMDCWAGHIKVKTMGKPHAVTSEQISESLRAAWLDDSTRAAIIHENEPAKPEMPTTRDAGARITPRMVGNRKCFSVHHQTPLAHLNYLRDMVAWLAQTRHRVDVLEIGSWVGESAVAMAQGLGSKPGCVYCVENFRGNPGEVLGEVAAQLGREKLLSYFKQNAGDWLGNRIRLLEGDSTAVAAKVPDAQVDMLFIDAGHSYQEVLDDLLSWVPKVKSDGIVCGHDLCDQFPGVEQAVTEFFGADKVMRYADSTIWWVNMESMQADEPEIADEYDQEEAEPSDHEPAESS